MIRSIKYIHEKYGQTHFQLSDSNFTINRTRTTEFCNKMISSGLSKKINFWIQTSISKKLSAADLELLKKAGVARISFGVERFSPEFREFMKKDGKLFYDKIKNFQLNCAFQCRVVQLHS